MSAWERYQSAVFDCDGVLLDSNAAKTAAFRELLGDADPERLEAFIRRHESTGGISRYEKLRWWYTHEEPREDIERAVARAADRFSEIASRLLEQVSLVPGVRGMLESLRGRGVPMWVISGGDQREVAAALRHHGLHDYFVDVLGSPTPKREHMASLLTTSGFANPAVFFGDAELDMKVAESHGLDFVFVAGCSDWQQGRVRSHDRGHRVVEDFRSAV